MPFNEHSVVWSYLVLFENTEYLSKKILSNGFTSYVLSVAFNYRVSPRDGVLFGVPFDIFENTECLLNTSSIRWCAIFFAFDYI